MADPYRQQRYHGQYSSIDGGQYGSQNHQQQYQNFPDGPSTSYGQSSHQQHYGQQGQYAPQQGLQREAYLDHPQTGQGHHSGPAADYGHAQRGFGQGGVPDAFVSDLAAGVLRQQGENYFQRGQAFVQSKMGFLSSSNLQYHFNVDGSYVREKLLVLALPFLSRWSFSRKPEQISGGHRYQPPRVDTYAPDLYIPFMAVCTYVVLVSIAQTAAGKFTHDNVYMTVSSTFTAWLAQSAVIKLALYLLGIPSAVPFLENLALAGYPFVHACLGVVVGMFGGVWARRSVLIYGGLAMGTFLVRTLKRVLFHDSPHYGEAFCERRKISLRRYQEQL